MRFERSSAVFRYHGVKLAHRTRVAGRIFIGTSGWSYKAWADAFYPPGYGPTRQFRHYVTRFATVELNGTFYRLPSEQAVAHWREQAPEGFVYGVKGSRTVTHFFKLQEGAKSFDILLERIEGLGPRMGPLLWQLPPKFAKDMGRLRQFVERLPQRYRYALEFRDVSWLDAEVYRLLGRHRIALVSLSADWFPRDLHVTTDFTYVRLHGLEGGPAHDYSRAELRPWAQHLRKCAEQGLDAYVYFNNDVATRAPFNAEMLIDMVGPHAVRPAKAAPQRRERSRHAAHGQQRDAASTYRGL